MGGPGLARRSDPDTSHSAAASVETTDLEGVVLNALRKNGPGTTEQIAAWTGLSLVTVSPRLNPLLRKELVRRKGKATNQSGRLAIVWEISP